MPAMSIVPKPEPLIGRITGTETGTTRSPGMETVQETTIFRTVPAPTGAEFKTSFPIVRTTTIGRESGTTPTLVTRPTSATITSGTRPTSAITSAPTTTTTSTTSTITATTSPSDK